MGPQVVISTFTPHVLRLDARTRSTERVKVDGSVLTGVVWVVGDISGDHSDHGGVHGQRFLRAKEGDQI